MTSSEEDAVAWEGKAGCAIHLALDQLVLVIDAFGTAVVIRASEGCGDRVQFLLQAAGEECR